MKLLMMNKLLMSHWKSSKLWILKEWIKEVLCNRFLLSVSDLTLQLNNFFFPQVLIQQEPAKKITSFPWERQKHKWILITDKSDYVVFGTFFCSAIFCSFTMNNRFVSWHYSHYNFSNHNLCFLLTEVNQNCWLKWLEFNKRSKESRFNIGQNGTWGFNFLLFSNMKAEAN